MIKQVPNLLSLARVAMVPLLVVLLQQQRYFPALLVFTIAGITDGVDGYIAKHFDAQSEFGKMLDPIADKLLLISAYSMLTLGGVLPFWLLVLVIFRDLVIVGGYGMLIALGDKREIEPSSLSKLNTTLQIILVIAVLLALGNVFEVPYLLPLLIALVAITTISSGFSYVWRGVKYYHPSGHD